MTILGAIVEFDRAVLWADSEIYAGDRPIGEGAKMALNPLGIGLVGAGAMVLIREGARAVQASPSIDKVEKRLATELRIRAGKLAPRMGLDDGNWFAGNVLVAAGFSPAAGRFVGWKFDSGAFFEASLVSRFCLPGGQDFDAQLHGVSTMGAILALARRQMAVLRTRLPSATGKSLTVAEISHSAIHCRQIPDFDVGPPVALSTLGLAPAVSDVDADAVTSDSDNIGG